MRIHGTGPVPSPYMLVSDYPGKEEDRLGRSLVGKTGKEVDRYLDGVSLPTRSSWYVTTLFKEWRPEGDYPQSDLERDEPELRDELAEVSPDVILTLGRNSARWFLGDVDLEDVHSIPWEQAEGRVVFPLYNPAAGFRSPELQAAVSYGFGQLSSYFAGDLKARRLFDDPHPNPVYLEVTDAAWLRAALTDVKTLWMDSEGWAANPWSIQFSVHPGTAYLIRKSRVDLLMILRDALRKYRPRIVFHSSLHDLEVFRSLGIDVIDMELEFGDTAVMAYLLQVEPLGLKPNCVRHCNMKMQSYDEVLGDVSDRLALDYAVSLHDVEQFDYEERQAAEFARINASPLLDKDGLPKRTKDGKIRLRRTTVLPSLPKSPLHKAAERVLRSRNPRKLWNDQIEDIRVAGYNRLGEMDEPTLDAVPASIAIPYGCRDADGTGRLEPELAQRIEGMGLGDVYALEIATYPLIDRMGSVGIKPDLPQFAVLSEELGFHIADLQVELEGAIGREGFNANSGDQVAEYLFGTLALPASKKTSEGRYSTNDKILEGLEREFGARFPVISTIREYRETYKLKNTFVDRIPDFVRKWPRDGRIHATFRTTRVVTGRLAASEPNILALPKHGKFAKQFRRGFVPESGHVFGSWDQSQIELRGLAHLSQDPVLLEAYSYRCSHPQPCERDECILKRDLHARLAHRIFGVMPSAQDDSKHRLPSKAVNFGLPMGMQAQGLSIELRKNGVMVGVDDAQKWIDETDKLYRRVPIYKGEKIAEARRNGYVRCLSGRIRYIGGIRSWDEFVRAEAERFAFSTPIQESAQWIMKQAEAHIWPNVVRNLQREGVWIEPIVQIHDDLVLEFDESAKARVNELMQTAMTKVPKGLSVPLKTDGKWGENWADLKKF